MEGKLATMAVPIFSVEEAQVELPLNFVQVCMFPVELKSNIWVLATTGNFIYLAEFQ